MTRGQPAYPFGPNHAVLSQGSWPRDRVLSAGFNRAARSSAGFMVMQFKIKNQTSRTRGEGMHLNWVHLSRS